MRTLVVAAILSIALGAGATDGAFSAVTTSPANTLDSGQGPWFIGTATGTAICAGTNASLSCAFGTLAIGKTTATLSLANKSVAATYTVTVVDGTGPAGISTIVTVSFASNGATTVTLAAVATDVISLVAHVKGSTPAGSYTGSVALTDSISGRSVAIPISLTR